jgi:hypothetical protein
MWISPDDKLCEARFDCGDWREVFNCVTLLAGEFILFPCLFLLWCFRRGNVKCLSELINDFDFWGLSTIRPPSRGVNGVDGENGFVVEWRPEDRGRVDP